MSSSSSSCDVLSDSDVARPMSSSIPTEHGFAEPISTLLLLGATFEDEEEIIWPESKPVLTQPDEPHAESGWPNTSCEMSFKSIKGEKRALPRRTDHQPSNR
jgi:hypothetical protein